MRSSSTTGNWECLIDTGYQNAWPIDDEDWDLLAGLIVDPLEIFILSHPDRDHYSAFELLGCAYRIAELLHASNEEAESVVKDLRAKLDHECPEVYEIGARISALHADPTRPVAGMELD